MDWYLAVLRKYSRFRGRARRKEYWYFNLCHLLIVFFLSILDNSISLLSYDSALRGLNLLLATLSSFASLAYSIYILATIIPSLAVTVRRLHDTGRSGWWYFITLIPFIGFLIVLFFLIEDSQPGKNQYGANPKETNTEPE